MKRLNIIPRVLSLVLSALVLCGMLSSCLRSGAANNGQGTPAVLQSDAFDYRNDDGLYSVAVFLGDIPEDRIRTAMSDIYGVDISVYDDDDSTAKRADEIRAEYTALYAKKQDSLTAFGCVETHEAAIAGITALTVAEARQEDSAAYRKALETMRKTPMCEAIAALSALRDQGIPVRERSDGKPDRAFATVTVALTEDEIIMIRQTLPGLLITPHENGPVSGVDAPETVTLSDGTEWLTAGQTADGKVLVRADAAPKGLSADEKSVAVITWAEEQFRYNASAYENDSLYNELYLPLIETVTAANRKASEEGRKAVPYAEMGITSWRENLPADAETAAAAEIEEVRCLRLWTLRELCAERIGDFAEAENLALSDIKADIWTTTIWLTANKSTVKRLADANGVTAIAGWDGSAAVECADGEEEYYRQLNQIHADPYTGTQSSQYNHGSGWTGSYMNVGVIEAISDGGNRFDASSPQLSDANRVHYIHNDDGTAAVSDHASLVTALIAGTAVTPIGEPCYSGVVPYANVWQTSCTSLDSYKNGINLLIGQGVTVINASLCIDVTNNIDGYSACDIWTDKVIRETRIPIVACAGNTSNQNDNKVTSPGKAFNVITVGSAATISDTAGLLSAPYSVPNSSNYLQGPLMDQKPDIAAPGNQLGYAKTISTVYTGSGTSYAAPLVTGVIAQMQQAYSTLKLRPVVVTKAMLLLGADYDSMTSTGDTAVSGCTRIREKSGAGFLNADEAVWAACRSSQFAVSFFDLHTVSSSYTSDLHIDLTAGDKFNTVFCTEANLAGVNYTSKLCNFDYELLSPDGVVVASSSSEGSVDILDYTASVTGRYTVRITLTAKNSYPTEETWFSLAYAFRID
ncbi:MAG: S8 family peptidase [Clostridia bacterium]|nr:S8 family peptidase [Clostridia bacterium]